MYKRAILRIASAMTAVVLALPAAGAAQSWNYIDPIPAGTSIQVRTTERIDASSIDGRVYRGTIENDVRDEQGRLAIPAGATAELVVRRASDDELVLDLDSVMVNGRRYAIDATRNRVGTSGENLGGIGANRETARNVGGGALLGAIIGGVIGGGDAALAGAAAGAAVGAGAQILTRGKRVNVPAEALLTYRLQSDINLDVQDSGYDRDGNHYHRFDR